MGVLVLMKFDVSFLFGEIIDNNVSVVLSCVIVI